MGQKELVGTRYWEVITTIHSGDAEYEERQYLHGCDPHLGNPLAHLLENWHCTTYWQPEGDTSSVIFQELEFWDGERIIEVDVEELNKAEYDRITSNGRTAGYFGDPLVHGFADTYAEFLTAQRGEHGGVDMESVADQDGNPLQPYAKDGWELGADNHR